MKGKQNLPGFFYITGCDGTGKTTQARLLVDFLHQNGYRVRHVWLRFPFFFSLPFLQYARLRRLSWSEVHEGQRFGYWDFRPSWIMCSIFPWVLLLDAFLAACWSIYLPLAFGWVVVCERFVLDMLVDLSLAYRASQFIKSPLGIRFSRLIPSQGKIIMLDLGLDLIRERRPDLVWDHRLSDRLSAFRFLAVEKVIPIIINQSSINDVHKKILTLFGIENASE